ncbi:MAG TPA: hypothetical protein VGW98_04125 [Solirubrobacteraceae bacterium]|jgi:hypothetical protein|nr:hypothetical protein [Solirubrobacteraceae bacterium]
MDINQGEPSAGSADLATRLEWWMSRRIRLLVLLACLTAVVLALLHAGTGVFSSTALKSARLACNPVVPQLARANFGQIRRLRASLLGIMAPLARRRYAWGPVPATVAWTDNPPESFRSSRGDDGQWEASYEMRAWARNGDDIGADVFLFAGARQARSFLDVAASIRCHRAASERYGSRPPGARNLVWVNPDGTVQEDVFVLRGLRVYRIAVVVPQRVQRQRSSAAQALGVLAATALACGLADAGCPARAAGVPMPASSYSRAGSVRARSTTAEVTRARS